MPYRIFYHRLNDMSRTVQDAGQKAQTKLGKSGGMTYPEVKAVFESIAKKVGIVVLDSQAEPGLFLVSFGPDANPRNSDLVATVNTSAAHIIYYTPFSCMYVICEQLFQRKAGYAVEQHLVGQKPLAKYGPHAIFYVVGHGDKLAGLMSCDCGKCGNDTFDGNGLSPYEVWDRLKGDGLPSNVTAIRIWSCLGADRPAGDPNSISFAAAFKRMVDGDDDYLSERTSIHSYSGFLTMTQDGGYSYLVRGDDTTRVRASERLVQFKEGSVEKQFREKKQA